MHNQPPTPSTSNSAVPIHNQTEVYRRFGDKPTAMLKSFNPVVCQSRAIDMNIKTARDAYLAGSISVSRLAKAYGRDSVYLLISIWINNLVEFSACEIKSKDEDFIEIGKLMYQTAPYLTVSEYSFFLIQCKKGVYGTFYGKFEPQKLMSWFDSYLDERKVAYQNIQRKISRIKRDMCWNNTTIRNPALSSLFANPLPDGKEGPTPRTDG